MFHVLFHQKVISSTLNHIQDRQSLGVKIPQIEPSNCKKEILTSIAAFFLSLNQEVTQTEFEQ